MERNTIQRALVLETVAKLKNHSTADGIYNEIASEHPNISRGTVYRNLNKLVENGKIRKVQIPDGPDRFDHRCCEHYHVKCVKCGGVFDVDMDYMGNLEKGIRDSRGFEFIGYNLVFDGVCPECIEKNGSRPAPTDDKANTGA